MTKLVIEDKCYTSVTREVNPDDDFDQGCTHTDVYVNSINIANRWHNLVSSFDVNPGDKIYLVYVTYTTGSTFGSASGNVVYVDVFKDSDEAYALEKEINQAYDNFKNPKPKKKGKQQEYDYWLDYINDGKLKKVYTGPWTGYFETLDNTHVESFVVGEEDDD